MSDPYDRGSSSRRRGVLSHWVPLLLTVTIATAGVAAWAWSQRNHDPYYDDEDEDDEDVKTPTGQALAPQPNDLDYEHADYGENPPYGGGGRAAGGGAGAAGSQVGVAAATGGINLTDATLATGPPSSVGGWSTRMSGALGPQQWVGSASKAVSAGVAAASAAVGGALASIREGDKDAYADHETWSEEVDARKERTSATAKGSTSSGRKRKTVALVVAADGDADGLDEDAFHEHASILSYIPRQNDFSKVRIFVLIYAPGLKESSTLDPSGNVRPPSLSSSFSNIGADQAQSTKADDDATAAAAPRSGNAAFNAVNAQALGLVEKESDIIPFTSTNGHAHILHLLEPDVVYLQESLAGSNGAVINQLQSWMRNDVVVVVGADGGHGGLADSESEAEKPGSADVVQKWWQREDRVGRGRGVVVVDGLRVNDDWVRRVQGQD